MFAYKEKTNENSTGIPDGLKNEMEKKSGMPLDHLRVEYNSKNPERYGALAYIHQNQIFMKSGEERHLKHEIVHGIQQMQGLTAGKSGVLEDPQLEYEADHGIVRSGLHAQTDAKQPENGNGPIQRKVGLEFQTYLGDWNVKKLKSPGYRETVEKIMRGETPGNINRFLMTADRVRLRKRSGYQVTTDGMDLEYITDAFDEETQGDTLRKAARWAGNFHLKIAGRQNPFGGIEVGAYDRIEADGDIFYVNRGGQITAHPQATIGVEYEKIPDLADKILAAKEGDLLYQDVPSAGRARKQLAEIRESAESYIETKTSEGKGPIDADRCKAFIELAEQDLKAANYRYREDVQLAAADAINGLIDSLNTKVFEAFSLRGLSPSWEAAAADPQRCLEMIGAQVEYEQLFLGNNDKGMEIRKNASLVFQEYEVNQRERKDLLDRKSIVENVLEIEKKRLNRIQGEGKVQEAERQRLQDRINYYTDYIEKKDIQLHRILMKNTELQCRWSKIYQDNNRVLLSIQDVARGFLQIEFGFTGSVREMADLLVDRYKELKVFFKEKKQLLDCGEIKDSYYIMIENVPISIEQYFKTNIAVKARTSLFDLCLLLDKKDRDFVFAYLDSHYQKEDLIYEETHGGYRALSYGEWKSAMYEHHLDRIHWELVNPRSSDDEEKRRRKAAYFGKFGVSRSTDIGHDRAEGTGTKKVEGALLELRKLEGNIRPEEWGNVADKIVKVVHNIHHPQQE